mmetsp:Transcript_17070/g.59759  ORF Transcript_17070/g.59759 Transcript_17070/m.59759 type:complete len:422 (-) Transcript_17070:120-1385(-)|eukprot:CAMPEP_0203911636 /NCGR_PEP_ID=MMETSP0359-20131031/52795_1 /ASSEMBLY_ACC=CAM_ASM_000338 /TAXON_ID=268821 /ORGANISM="Scrippsiella Hangoei, Strain SHTV-5" /LENGTH=421 /DNA_ID=CAMNT_0050837405 /DNA_START=94 /DNA_END=1359 /DNA_ORIENTATION=+
MLRLSVKLTSALLSPTFAVLVGLCSVAWLWVQQDYVFESGLELLPSNTSSWRVATALFANQQRFVARDWRKLPNCTIDHLDSVEWRDRFLRDYHLQRPAILRDWRRSWVEHLQAETDREALVQHHGESRVFTALPTELVRDGQKKARTAEVLKDYIAAIPGQRYFFDDGSFMREAGLDQGWETLPGLESLGTFNDWAGNTTSEIAGSETRIRGPALTFSLGGPGQGVAFHIHGDSYNLQLHGRKRWAVYAPGEMTRSGFSRLETFAEWLRKRRAGSDFAPPSWECVQGPGETLYIPEGFYHGTVCVDDCVGIVHQAERLVQGTAFDSFVRSRGRDAAGNFTRVWQHLQQAIRLDGTNSDYWMELGVVCAEIGRWADAVECLRRALHFNPLNADARYNFAKALVKTGKRLEAVQTLLASLWL